MRLGVDDIALYRPTTGLTEADLPFHIVKPGGSIQNAVTAAVDGRAIWIWPGTYNIAATIAVPHPVRVMGTGRDTVIFAQAAMNLQPIFQVANAVAEFWISDLRLNGAGATFPDFVDFAGTSGTVIFDNIETHALMRAFIAQSGGGGMTSLLIDHCNVSGGLDCRESNADLRDSTFAQIGAGPGYLFTTAGAHEYRVSRCRFILSAVNPLDITTAAPGCFNCVGSRFYGDTPIRIYDGEVSFEGCNFIDNAGNTDLRIEGGTIKVTNSHLNAVATFGAGAADIFLSNNELDDAILSWAGSAGQWIIRGNIFRGAGVQAIQLLGGDRHTVIGNSILASNNPAIDIQGDDTTVVGNALVAGGTINDGGANNVMGLNRIGA